jgi:hypothetical protein
MEVKGTAFIARRSFLARVHGEARFHEVMAEVIQRDPLFADTIVATTRIPVDAFLRFNEVMVDRLYAGDEQSYVTFGVASAEWALTQGPYKHMVQEKSVERFAASAPVIYRTYFTDGDARGEVVSPRRVDTFITGIAVHHVYFEYAIMGYFARGLELVSRRMVTKKIHRGYSRDDADVHYEFQLGSARPGEQG